jgi:mRNA interferase RelE/StbE
MANTLKIFFKPSVEKDFSSLPKDIATCAMVRINGLADDPLPPGTTKLSGSQGLYRLRVGNYRVVYEVDEAGGMVLNHYVRHRREAYRGL